MASKSDARIVAWHDVEVNGIVRSELTFGMKRTVQLLVGIAKKKVSRGQPTRTTKSGIRYGLDPSKPFEPPKVVTARLKQSIKGRVRTAPAMVRGYIGTDVPYGRHLELGHRGGTRSGQGAMAPRPYLRPTILENKRLILRTLTGGA